MPRAIWISTGFLALIAANILPAHAAAPSDQKAVSPVIESIEGDRIVIVKKPNGNTVGEKGTFVDFGDRIKTGPRASAKIRYPDGSKLLIGRGTEMEVQDAKGGVQFNELKSGEVRGIIAKPKNGLAPNAPPRFVIRSRSAVMGVRGTDFVMNLDDEAAKAKLHTLDGTVEVAPDEQTLMQGKGVRVEKDQTISADSGKISMPERFDRRAYDQALEAAQPEFVALVSNDKEIAEHNSSSMVADAQEALDDGKPRGLKLFMFSINSLFLKQQSGGEIFSGQVAWNPSFYAFGLLTVRGHLAMTVLKGRTQSDKFIARQTGLILGLEFLNPLLLEAGVGDESWGDHGSNSPYAMATLAYRLPGKRLIERIFIGASGRERTASIDGHPRNGAITLRAGVGVQF